MKQQKQRVSRRKTSCASSEFDSRAEQEVKPETETLSKTVVKAPVWKKTKDCENGTSKALPIYEIEMEDIERRSSESDANERPPKPERVSIKRQNAIRHESARFLGKSSKIGGDVVRNLKRSSVSFFAKSRAAPSKSSKAASNSINVEDIVVKERHEEEDELNMLEEMTTEICGSRNLRSCLLDMRSKSKDESCFRAGYPAFPQNLEEILDEIEEDMALEGNPERQILGEKLSFEKCDKML